MYGKQVYHVPTLRVSNVQKYKRALWRNEAPVAQGPEKGHRHRPPVLWLLRAEFHQRKEVCKAGAVGEGQTSCEEETHPG